MGRLPRQLRPQQLTHSAAAIILLSAAIITIPSAAAAQSAATNFIDFLSAARAGNDNLAVESQPSVTIVKSDKNPLKRNLYDLIIIEIFFILLRQ